MLKKAKQAGFSLITAIFILVILSVVASFAVSMASKSRETANLIYQGELAFFAARSGLEWGVYKVTTDPSKCPATTVLKLKQGALTNFTVTVNCAAQLVTEGAATYNIFKLNSLAERGTFGGADYISREMEVSTTLGG